MSLAPGVYLISQWGTSEPSQFLTYINGIITLSPRTAGQFQMTQEWSVESQKNGNVAIQNPARIFPSRSLSFEGEPKEGDRIIPGPLSDSPTREWCVEAAPEKLFPLPSFIHVPNEKLIVAVSLSDTYPPKLSFTTDFSLRNAWVFEKVHAE